jgi:CcmD family protein
MSFSLIQVQEDTTAVVDTLSKSYSSKWEAASGFEEASPLMQMMASNDLIFIVLGVSLIIWLVLLFFMIRIDRKVGRLENELEHSKAKEA